MTGRVTPDLCAKCHRLPTAEGHDGCLGTLPGVWNACCGHGNPREAYVQFRPGPVRMFLRRLGLVDARRIAGAEALDWIRATKDWEETRND